MLYRGNTYYLVIRDDYAYCISRVRGYKRIYGGAATAYTLDGVNGFLIVPFVVDVEDEVVEDPRTYPLEPLDHLIVSQHKIPDSVRDKYVEQGEPQPLSKIKPWIDAQLMLYGYRLKTMTNPEPIIITSLNIPIPENLTPGKAVVFMLYMYKRLIDLSLEEPLNHYLRHTYKIQYLTAKFLKTGQHYDYEQHYLDWKYVTDTLVLHRVFNLVTSMHRLFDIYPFLTIGTRDMVIQRLLPPSYFTETITYPQLLYVAKTENGELLVQSLRDTREAMAQIARYQLAKKLMIITRDTVYSILSRITGAKQ